MRARPNGRALSLSWKGRAVRWYTAGCLREVALIRPSVRTGAPSPQGKALVTQYNFARWYHLKKPSPGGKVAAKQTNEGYLLKAVRSVLRQPRTVRDHESNPFGEAKHHKTRKALPIRESLSYLSMSVNGEDFQD